jgi:hypothetical protein
MTKSVGQVSRGQSFLKAVSGTLLALVFVLSSSSSRNDTSIAPRRDSTSHFAMPPIEGSVAIDIHLDRGNETIGALTSPSKMLPQAENATPADSQRAKPTEPESLKPLEPGIRAGRPQVPRVDEVDGYLWSVYQRSGTKLDSHGDFTWKDAAAAARMDLSIREYVIDGMDPDFRELLFHAGQAMDAAGINWTILSAFRDDYRQSLAAGYKAHNNNSFHGGTAATGGYGHGCAVDIASTDGELFNSIVWNWLDQHGEQFGLNRPLGRVDPAHVLPRRSWHQMAAMLRNERLASAEGAASSNIAAETGAVGPLPAASADPSSDASITQEQFNCVRPRPPNESDQLGETLQRLQPLVSRLPILTAEKKQAKAKWRTAGGAAIHRIDLRRSPADDGKHPADQAKHNARWKGRIRLTG